jgi:asparagine synthase (glutamine-hydrolysing)
MRVDRHDPIARLGRFQVRAITPAWLLSVAMRDRDYTDRNVGSADKMSIIAGVIAFTPSGLGPEDVSEIRAAFPATGLHLSSYVDGRFALLHGSLGLLDEKDYVRSSEYVGGLAGALLVGRGRGGSPLESAAKAVLEEDLGFFADANGTFAGCFYEPGRQRLTLVSDGLGARPMCYAVARDRLYFSTSLAVLERIEAVPKRLELAACIEQEALCYPLGPRTIYRSIQVLRDNEAVVVSPDGIEAKRYFDWGRLPTADGDTPHELAVFARKAVRDAVSDRAAPGSTVTSLLSGGIDSRVVVAELLDIGCRVHAITVSRPGTQDSVYAQRFAQAARVPHEKVSWASTAPGLTAGETTQSMLAAALRGHARGLVFSGDGGGETLGFLLLDGAALEFLAGGDRRRGAEQYLAHSHPVERLFDPAVYPELETVAVDRLESELGAIGTPSLEKALHVSVLVNDLRCHLHEYFNRLAETRVELLLPFYDRRVVASVVRIPPPLGPHLKHAFYYRVLASMPRIIEACPWQVYPGHLPCPVPDPDPPVTQWEWAAANPAADDRWGRQALRAAFGSRFPPFVRRSTVLAASLGHTLRLANYAYVFRSFLALRRLNQRASSWVVREDEAAGEGPSPDL